MLCRSMSLMDVEHLFKLRRSGNGSILYTAVLFPVLAANLNKRHILGKWHKIIVMPCREKINILFI